MQCTRTCDVILMGVRANIGGCSCFGEVVEKWRLCTFMGNPTVFVEMMLLW